MNRLEGGEGGGHGEIWREMFQAEGAAMGPRARVCCGPGAVKRRKWSPG